MAMLKTYLVSLLQWILLMYTNIEAQNLSIVTEPTDKTFSFQYEDVTVRTAIFHFVVGNLQTGHAGHWHKNGVQISSNGYLYDTTNVDNSRYAVAYDVIGSYTYYRLTIATSSTTGEYDTGQYKCIVSTTPNLRSRVARLHIYVRPQAGYIKCSVGVDHTDDNLNVIEGTPVSLQCRSDPTGVPAISTDWIRNGYQNDVLETNRSTDSQDNSTLLTYYWTPTRQENSATFTCKEFHPDNDVSIQTCQLGPFNVQYKPTAEISPPSHTVTKETQVIAFSCIAVANPSVTSYVWLDTSSNKFTQQSDRVSVSPDGSQVEVTGFTKDENGVYYVTCRAENAIGRSVTASSNLTVNIPSITTVTMHSTGKGTLPGSSVHADVTRIKQTGLSSQKESATGYVSISSPVYSGTTTNTYVQGETSNMKQNNIGTAIIGTSVGVCGLILMIVGVLLVIFCIRKSNEKVSRRDPAETHQEAVENPYNDIETINVGSADPAPPPYSSVNPSDADHNADNTNDEESASITVTLQAKIFIDRNKSDAIKSDSLDPDIMAVGNQRGISSKRISGETQQSPVIKLAQTVLKLPTQEGEKSCEEGQMSAGKYPPSIHPKPKPNRKSDSGLNIWGHSNNSGYDNGDIADIDFQEAVSEKQSLADGQHAQNGGDISVTYACVDMSKKKLKSGGIHYNNTEEGYHEDTATDADTNDQQVMWTEANPQHKNVEGLTYAELNLSSTMLRFSTKESSNSTEHPDDTVYAEVRV